ncbi:MAG: HYR domain-containing protein [Actinomycetota bacterium]|nr:HYR domain-containing protein [Actinomycetota bacterium]
MSRKRISRTALVALTAFFTVAATATAFADSLQSDGDVLSGGLSASISNCLVSHDFTGQARISASGSTHFAGGAIVTISYTSPSPKITVTGGNVTLSNPWNNASTDKTRSIGVHVDSGITNGTYHIDGSATGNKAGGGTLTVTDTFNVIVNCPTNTAPTLNLPADITVEAQGASGATVTYTVTATDAEDNPDPTPSCSPASGSVFALGTTTVQCSVTDSNGTTTNGSFKIVVHDTTGPVLSLANVTAEATGPSGASVSFSPSASDLVDGNVAVNCDANSGATFALGTTAVNCSATDSAGNTSSGAFTVKVQDTTAPELSIPGDIVTEADGATGSVVLFTASATDLVDGNVAVNCDANSGDTFPLGTTTVTCGASDAAGNAAAPISFTVKVQDTMGPTIDAHLDVTAEATSSAGAVVSYTSPATHDAVDGAGTASCSPASGTTFALGNTTVSCNKTDAAGNAATQTTFTVTVQDTTAPTLNLPADITAEATGSSGAAVSYTATATDLVDGSRPVTCLPASGTTFAIGTTTVNCSANDLQGNTANGSFSVKVQDTTAPALSLPANMVRTATSNSGAPVSYTATATDLVDGSRPVTCSPASGTTFAIGTTTVDCSSTDSHGNTAQGSFTINVVYGRDGGIRQPINPDNTSVFKRGQAVPVKFGLSGDPVPNGFDTSAWKVSKASVSCTAGFDAADATLEDVGSITPTTTVRYDATADQYIYNADFKSAGLNTCWKIAVDLKDGSPLLYSAVFKTVK